MTRHSEARSEIEDLSHVIGAFYDAALEPEVWPEALRLATGFVDGVAANLFWQHPVAHDATVFHAWGDNSDYVASYFERYAALNPLFPAASFVEPGIVFSGGDLVPHELFRQTRFFLEWVEPQGFIDVIGVNLHRFTVGVAAFTVRRSKAQGVVDDEMRRKVALLVPHVHRALMIGREVEGERGRTARLETVLGQIAASVFLVEASGRIEFSNEAGAELLDRGDVLYRWGDGLVARDHSAEQALRAAIASAAVDGDLGPKAGRVSIAMVDREGARHLVHVLPLASPTRRKARFGTAAVAALFVRRAEMPIMSGLEAAAKLHGLTPGEIKVLGAVLTMGSRDEIASALGLSVSTVKTHLAALFSKTGAQRRADLIKMVAAQDHTLG